MPTDNKDLISDAEEQVMREAIALKERYRVYQSDLVKDQVYRAIKPLIESDEFMALHQQIADLWNNGPRDDHYFSMGIESVFNGMTLMGTYAANWTTPIDPTAPPAPTPTAEGSTDAE